MSETGINCTKCSKELEPFEDVVIVAAGSVGPAVWRDYAAQMSKSPFLEVLCSTCRKPKPNRVLVRVDYEHGIIEVLGVWATRPDDVIISVLDSWWEPELDYQPEVFGGPNGQPILKLNTMKEEHDER